jgi:hypothetical protein
VFLILEALIRTRPIESTYSLSVEIIQKEVEITRIGQKKLFFKKQMESRLNGCQFSHIFGNTYQAPLNINLMEYRDLLLSMDSNPWIANFKPIEIGSFSQPFLNGLNLIIL